MIAKATDADIQEALALISQRPLENFILIADLTQLRPWCDILVHRTDGTLTGVFALYRDLDFIAGAFWTQSSRILSALINEYGDEMQRAKMVFICTREQLQLVKSIAKSVEALEERQMVMEDPSKLRCKEHAETFPLSHDDADELLELYQLAGTPAWTPNALDLGPFYGVRNEEGKLVAAAGVHFVTEYGAELGNVATHPNHRRKGYARCVIEAVSRDLLSRTERVVLHFFKENIAAQKLYEQMGFEYSPADPVYFTKAELH